MWFLAYKLIRPILPLSSALAAWIISQACGADTCSSMSCAAAIALSTIGASLYHYGGANWMYTRKSERLEFRDPQLLMLSGLTVFCLSIAIAVQWLPKQCVYILLFNTLSVAAYSAKLSSHWTTKNLTMSLVCATPVAIGWQAGHTTHPLVPWALCLTVVAHLAREMIKDVKDILANHGRRVTLPMILGTETVLQISGALLLAASALPLYILRFSSNNFQRSMLYLAMIVLLGTSAQLIVRKKAGHGETAITTALLCTLLALV